MGQVLRQERAVYEQIRVNADVFEDVFRGRSQAKDRPTMASAAVPPPAVEEVQTPGAPSGSQASAWAGYVPAPP